MTRTFVRPPNRYSTSARILARRLGVPLIRRENSRYRYRSGDWLINWGNPTDIPGVPQDAYLNRPECVQNAISKDRTWELLDAQGVQTVWRTPDWDVALRWLTEGSRVLVRTSLRGSQGRGIAAYSREGSTWTLPIGNFEDTYHIGGTYVKVFGARPRHVDEYRVHVMDSQVLDVTMKKKRRGVESNPYIRSYHHGWVYAREGIAAPDVVLLESKCAVAALGLAFGAVDIAHDREAGTTCVYEVNSAPGLEGTTLEAYVEALI